MQLVDIGNNTCAVNPLFYGNGWMVRINESESAAYIRYYRTTKGALRRLRAALRGNFQLIGDGVIIDETTLIQMDFYRIVKCLRVAVEPIEPVTLACSAEILPMGANSKGNL